MLSLVVPVYKNEDSIPDLLEVLAGLNRLLDGEFEAVIVVDGSPDRSLDLLIDRLPEAPFAAQLLVLSRNFGSFAAIRAGLAAGSGEAFAVMAADLQEPPELILELVKKLATGTVDIVVGMREARGDPLLSRLCSAAFWAVYRVLAQREVPPGGVDVFGCTREFRDRLLVLTESNSTLVGLIFWLGFRRDVVRYRRMPRVHGRSAWGFSRRLRYLLDSCFAFSDLPIRLMTLVGALGITISVGLSIAVLVAKWTGQIPMPGYTATVLTVIFFGGVNSLGLGLIGEYLWRTFENTKNRPPYLVATHRHFQRGTGS